MGHQNRRTLGSKVELASGKWRLEVSAGRDPVTGKRRRPRETFHGDERAAERRLAQMLAETGRYVSSGLTLWEYIETMYLPAIAPPELRKRTVDGYREKLEKYVKDSAIADLRMDRLTRYAMVTWMRGVKSRVPNKQSQLHVYSVLSAALGRAVRWGVLEENILRKAVEPPEPDEVHPAVLTVDEWNDYLDAFVGHEVEPIVVLGLACGLRPSESMAVEGADLDLEQGLVRVDQTIHQRDGIVWIEDTKSRESNRVLPLPGWAIDALKRHRRIGRLCGDLTPDQIRYRYKKHVGACGLEPWCPLENLRHTSLTIAVDAGISWEDAASWAGHTSPKMLRTRYVKRRLLRDQLTADVMQNVRRLEARREAK